MDSRKINIIQFLPYFPPHKGGLETHAQQWGFWWVKKGYGRVVNVVMSVGQTKVGGVKGEVGNGVGSDWILDEKGRVIGYREDGYDVLVMPAFDIISGFSFPKFWTKNYWNVFKYLRKVTSDWGLENSDIVVVTRTRFFLSSFLGGFYAKKNKLRWCHIEHGSDYVKLSSKFKNWVAKIYDKIIGKWIFKKADIVVPISKACEKFIRNEFVDREMEVIYRGIEIPSKNGELEMGNGKLDFSVKSEVGSVKGNGVENLREMFPGKIIIGYLGRLYKWKNVDSLIKAFYSVKCEVGSVKLNSSDISNSSEKELKIENLFEKQGNNEGGVGSGFRKYACGRKLKIDPNRLQLVVVGYGEELENLKKLDKDNLVYFAGGKDFDEAIALQSQFDIHVHSSCPGGGISSVLMQAMALGCTIVSTPFEGADEVIVDGENGVLVPDCSEDSIYKGIKKILELLTSEGKGELKIENGTPQQVTGQELKINEELKLRRDRNREIVEEKFVWDRSIGRYYKVLMKG